MSRDKERQAFVTRKLLEWFHQQTGVQPIRGNDDPTAHYQRLRDEALRILHGESTVSEAEVLAADTIAWFDRLFTPPSDRISYSDPRVGG